MDGGTKEEGAIRLRSLKDAVMGQREALKSEVWQMCHDVRLFIYCAMTIGLEYWTIDSLCDAQVLYRISSFSCLDDNLNLNLFQLSMWR